MKNDSAPFFIYRNNFNGVIFLNLTDYFACFICFVTHIEFCCFYLVKRLSAQRCC